LAARQHAVGLIVIERGIASREEAFGVRGDGFEVVESGGGREGRCWKVCRACVGIVTPGNDGIDLGLGEERVAGTVLELG